MFSDTVTYDDYNGKSQTDTLWFNINKTDVLQDISIIDRAEAVERMVEGDPRELNTAEKQQVLNMVQEYVKLAYGVKSADGRHFRKTQEVWDDFRWSNAYDAYLLKLFEEPQRAAEFGANVLPKNLRDEALADGRLKQPSEVDFNKAVEGNIAAEEEIAFSTVDDRPQWLIENRPPSDRELRNSDKKYHAEGFRLKMAEHSAGE